MKKLSFLITLVSILFGITACSNPEKDLEIAKEAYLELNEVYKVVDIYASDTYSAWRHGIYEDNQSKFSLSLEVSLSSSELIASVCAGLGIFDDFNYSTSCVIQSHEELGNYSAVQESLDKIKDLIKQLKDSKNEDANEYGDELQGYYSTVLNLFNLAKEYSGSFNSIQIDIREYRNQANQYKNDLEFDLG